VSSLLYSIVIVQTINHIVDACSSVKFDDGSPRLHQDKML